MERVLMIDCQRHCTSPKLAMAGSLTHGMQIEAQMPVAISKRGQRPMSNEHVRIHKSEAYPPSRQRNMVWDSTPAYRIAPSDVVAASTVQGPGNSSMRPSSLALQHRDSVKLQNRFCSPHHCLCIQLLTLRDLRWLGWDWCAEHIPFMFRSVTRVFFVL